jgi:hypothetical protein
MNKNSQGRRPISVRIITDLTVVVQSKTSKQKRRRKRKAQRVYLPTLTLVIRYNEDGDLSIETEPP